MKLCITISKYHLWYLCQITLQIMLLLPIQIPPLVAPNRKKILKTLDGPVSTYMHHLHHNLISRDLLYDWIPTRYTIGLCLKLCTWNSAGTTKNHTYLFIYLFNHSHHDYNAKIRLGKKYIWTSHENKRWRCGKHNRARLQIKCALKKNTQILCKH